MKPLRDWTKLPSAWIEEGRLREFRWTQGQGSDNTAALIVLAVIAHHVEPESGISRLTYGSLSDMASLSRAKVSAGLTLLETRSLIDREPDGRSSYRLCCYDPAAGWAKFPAKGLYRNDVVAAFTEFRLRRAAELEALKLFFLFAARRSRETNSAKISYDRIEEYSGVIRNNIRRALSVLTANGLVHIEHCSSELSEYGTANAYRLAHLDTYNHMGTRGRAADSFSMGPLDWPST
jgi:DNA-binding transcriptional ArsR family regulator